MRGQWLAVGLVVALLGGGVALLVARAPTRIAVGVAAPDFKATDIATGELVSFREKYRGVPVLVNVWATWCDPCKEEIPAMDSLYRALGPRGFRIAAVSIDVGAREKVVAFAKQYGITFDVLHDPTQAISEIFQTTGVPESFLIDRNGHIVRVIQHAAPWNSTENRRIVETLLATAAR